MENLISNLWFPEAFLIIFLITLFLTKYYLHLISQLKAILCNSKFCNTISDSKSVSLILRLACKFFCTITYLNSEVSTWMTYFYIVYTNICILQKVKISPKPAMQRLHGLQQSWEQHPGNSWSRTKAVQDLGGVAVTFPAQLQHCSEFTLHPSPALG